MIIESKKRSKLNFIFYFFIASFTNSALGLSVGDTVPQVVGRKIDGSMFSLANLNKKPKLINFFWVDCPPCLEELVYLAKKESLNPSVIFVAIHAEINYKTQDNYNIEDIVMFSKKLKRHPLNLVLGSHRLKEYFKIKGFPVNILLDENNKVEKILYGYNSRNVGVINHWLSLKNGEKSQEIKRVRNDE